ncbi:MAG: S-layer homology domain-containing protein [Clostridia bacterium]|nr:S-layer homology domain-containing protein [Clostridia bacterium]
MSKNFKKILVFVIAATLFTATAFLSAYAQEETISESGSYTYSGTDPIVISDGVDVTLTLSNANISNADGAAISIGTNSNVTIILEGENVLSASSTVCSAGIFVPRTSVLTVEGTGSLDVTGGKYGAGIGSYGTGINVAPELRLQCGEIIINSGNITAHGGANGAGIGSGYHVDGYKITINGGTIYAYGTSGGAGIGTGYGTSGGAAGVAAVGDYTPGEITITGGNIYAASYELDFDNLDYMDPSTYSGGSQTFAAGIGGGYGSSGGTINISGGNITAVGSCGGAGIGSGRGTSKAKNYNENSFYVDITISGDANIIAIGGNDERNDKGGGAGIGSGRGTHTGGTILIKDDAYVVAISAPYANAIGCGAEKNPVDGSMPVSQSIIIDEDVILYALSYGNTGIDVNAEYLYYYNNIGYDNSLSSTQTTIGYVLYDVPANSISLWANMTLPDSGNSGNENGDPASGGTSTGSGAPVSASDPISLSNEYAYIFGYDDQTMAGDMPILRGEASAVLYRLLKQNDRLSGFNYSRSNEPLFSDVDGRWDRSALEFMAYLGLYDVSSDTVSPDSPILRGEAFKIFAVALEMTDELSLSYEDYANMLISKGFVQGDENGNINIYNNITRAEFCKIYNMMIGRDQCSLEDADGNVITPETYGFTDFDSSDWYYEIMLKATSAYTNGKVDLSKRAIRNVVDDYE